MFRFPLLPLALLVILSIPANAAVRLTTAVNGAMVEVAWPADAFPIKYKTDSRVVSALPGGNAMLDRSFNAWAQLDGARVSFQADGITGGLKAAQDGINSITLADDLFANQRAIAVTTNWDVAGTLTESDIQIDSTLINGSYNMQQALTHEVGHLLGLDHSGVLSAVMYPYVSRGNEDVLIDSDDRVGITAMYPEGDRTMNGGILRGRVQGDGGAIFAAQVVAVNERGEPVATGLSNQTGEFTLEGIPEGRYRIYAEPLDGPVDPRNLSPFWRQGTVTSFPTQFISGEVDVVGGRVYGNLMVTAAGAVGLNPRWLGVTSQGANDFKLTSTAVTVRAGQTISLAVAGDGMTSGLATFEVLSPGVQRVSDFRYSANYVYADFQIPGTQPAGSAVILVRRGTETAALTGAVRIQSGSGGRTRIAAGR
jgi:hypothetical protein